MKKYIYLDTENVSIKSQLSSICRLTPNDVLLLFYTESTASFKLSVEDFVNMSVNCKLVPIKVGVVGKNSLDFVLVTELTRRAISASKSKHCVISKDSGYISAILRLRHLTDNMNIKQYKDIAECFD